jgi:hypothetical protein
MEKNVSRKRFLAWGVGISSLLAVPALLKFRGKKKSKRTTVKMLTQEGKLVEINVADIPSKKKKINPSDIHTWINRKTSM